MNKEQLIAKCKEIEPNIIWSKETSNGDYRWIDFEFGDKHNEILIGIDNDGCVSVQGEQSYFVFKIELISLVQQYFKENENE